MGRDPKAVSREDKDAVRRILVECGFVVAEWKDELRVHVPEGEGERIVTIPIRSARKAPKKPTVLRERPPKLVLTPRR